MITSGIGPGVILHFNVPSSSKALPSVLFRNGRRTRPEWASMTAGGRGFLDLLEATKACQMGSVPFVVC